MAPPTATDVGLERHRQRLELSLEKLRKALLHWQIFSAEYEAFREGLQALPTGASREDMLAVGADFGGTVVDEKEIKTLLGDKMGVKRSLAQVIATVGHRISYVQENVTKVGKQIEQGEIRLASLMVVAAPDLTNEEGLPIMDIREELDEEDNVVAATINGNDPLAPAKAIDTEGLEKLVGIVGEDQKPPDLKAPAPAPAQKPKNKPRNPSPLHKVTTQDQRPNDTSNASSKPPVVISSATEDGGGLVKVLDDAPEVAEKDWVQSVPGESDEDTELRREMLKYNMAEIGAVVAEINLDEDGDFYGYEDSDDYDDDDDYDEDNNGDGEDKYGRTTYTVITPELQREMEELQRRVKERAEAARNGGAVGEKDDDGETGKKKGVRFATELDIAPAPVPPSPSTAAPIHISALTTEDTPSFPVPPSALNEEDAIPLLLDLLAMDEVRKAGLQQAPEKPENRKPSIFKTARTGTTTTTTTTEAPTQQRTVPTSALAPTVLERSPNPISVSAPTTTSPRKPSRFAAARAAASIYTNTTPHAPEDDTDSHPPTLSSAVIERAPSAATTTATPPDELDPSIHRREVASEFHRMRTKMIQQQGGFVESEEEGATVPLNEDGEKRKVSRFKAARLKMGQP